MVWSLKEKIEGKLLFEGEFVFNGEIQKNKEFEALDFIEAYKRVKLEGWK